MKTTITPQEIFSKNQILTLAVVKQLIGKKIAVTNSEYHMNTPWVRIGTVEGIDNEWDLAGKQDHRHLDGGKYATRQAYWRSYMKNHQIEERKNTIKLLADNELYCTCEIGNPCLAPGTFFGSDADREIYYMVIEE